jgi:hypothetical protein
VTEKGIHDGFVMTRTAIGPGLRILIHDLAQKIDRASRGHGKCPMVSVSLAAFNAARRVRGIQV